LIQSKITERYIKALLDIAAQQGRAEDVEGELYHVDQLLKSNTEFMHILLHPKISRLRKKKLLDDILGAKISETVKRFLDLLVEKKREAIIAVLYEAYKQAADRMRGIVKATVNSAIDLSPERQKKCKAVLEQKLKSTVEAQFAVDATILGGLQIFIGNDVLDGSIRGRLDKLQKHILELNVS
jgi:F-type H+-transporting ATPase subunit delta